METQQNEVLIDDIDIDTMERFLTFLYEAALPEKFDFDSFSKLLRVGDKYQVTSLTKACASMLAENICTNNAVQAAILGFLCNNDSMKSKAIKAILDRDKGVTLGSMKGYKDLKGYPDLLAEIIDFGHGPDNAQPVKSAKRKRTIKGGIVVEDLSAGNGPEAKRGKMVGMYYEGRLKSNNKKFDAILSGKPFKFRLGHGEVIKGWDLGVEGMKVGSKLWKGFLLKGWQRIGHSRNALFVVSP